VVDLNHDCHLHEGEPVKIGSHTVYAGGIRLSKENLAQTDLLVSFCDHSPTNVSLLSGGHLKFPMADFGGVPESFGAFLKASVIPVMECGLRVTIHCMGGFGRTGTALAGLIALLEPDISNPVAAVRERYCPFAVETPAQEAGITALKNAALAERLAAIEEGE
jgi:hypothetical protein